MAAALFVSGRGWAGDATLAESLFREGRALMESGDYAEACPKLAESQAQDPATGTLLALAFCQEALGKTASAWTSFGEAAARAKREGSAEREQAAREEQAALEPKLSRLTVKVSRDAAALEGLVVTRDDVEMGRAAWGSALAIDPGKHVIEATAPGHTAWRKTVTIGGEADAQVVEVPSLDAAGGAGGLGSGAATEGGAELHPDAGEGHALSTIGLVTGGVGIVGLGVGGFFGLRAMSLGHDSDAGCNANDVCNADAFDKRNAAIDSATVSTVAFIAGGVLTAVGVTLFVLDRGDGSTEQARASAVVGPGAGAVTIDGRF